MLDELIVALIASVLFGSIVYFSTNLQCSFLVFWIVYAATLATGIGKAVYSYDAVMCDCSVGLLRGSAVTQYGGC